jgi:hypothetical protein
VRFRVAEDGTLTAKRAPRKASAAAEPPPGQGEDDVPA